MVILVFCVWFFGVCAVAPRFPFPTTFLCSHTPGQSSPGNEGVLYSVAWAPQEDRVAVASSKNHVVIFDTVRGRVDNRSVFPLDMST